MFGHFSNLIILFYSFCWWNPSKKSREWHHVQNNNRSFFFLSGPVLPTKLKLPEYSAICSIFYLRNTRNANQWQTTVNNFSSELSQNGSLTISIWFPTIWSLNSVSYRPQTYCRPSAIWASFWALSCLATIFLVWWSELSKICQGY